MEFLFETTKTHLNFIVFLRYDDRVAAVLKQFVYNERVKYLCHKLLIQKQFHAYTHRS